MAEVMEEIVRGKLVRVAQEAKRNCYFFDVAGREQKYSAFPPNLPVLMVGVEYEFPVQHKPTGDGKQYHNLVREAGKDSEYDISPIGQNTAGKPLKGDVCEPAPMGLPDKPKPAYQPASGLAASRDGYWEAKDKRDAAKEPLIVRESCLSSAARVIAAIALGRANQPEGIVTNLGLDEFTAATIKMAAKFEEYVKTGNATENGKTDKPKEKREGD